MLASVASSAVWGINALDVQVEVDVSQGLPLFEIVGLAGTAVKEARNRVRAALKNSGFTFPLGRVTVNLAPAHVPKSGTLYDLPIAVGILAASGQISQTLSDSKWVVIGELSLDGSLRPVRGALCVASSLRGARRVLVAPESNRAEIEAVPGLAVLTAHSLSELVESLRRGASPQVSAGWTPDRRAGQGAGRRVWGGIRGQRAAKRALQIAVAGGHHALLIGPPGSGKTQLAQRTVALMPELTPEEGVEVSRVYSVAGLLSEERPLVAERPFRSPHHSVTTVGLLGGGSPPRPGEVSLAHRGILFMDEFPEFGRAALEGLRQPLEEGVVHIARSGGAFRFPAEFTLIAAANPCPCGYLGDPLRPCSCRPVEVERYRRRFSGPLMDRIDLVVAVERPDIDDFLKDGGEDEDGANLLLDIARARRRQASRFGDHTRRNGEMSPEELARHVPIDHGAGALLRRAGQAWSLSPRGLHKVLKVARTVCDLSGGENVSRDHVAEALSYRKEGVLP